MISDDLNQAIKVLSRELNEQHLEYALIGSSNLALQGMDLCPRDLDLVMRIDDLKKVPKIFWKYLPSDVEELKPDPKDPAWSAKLIRHPAWNVHFDIGKIPVQILGESDDGDYVHKLISKRLIYIRIDEISVPCFNLEAEAQAYQETFRPLKAEKIRNFLDSKTDH